MTTPPQDAGQPAQGWADSVLDRLDVADTLDRTLITAIHGYEDLAGETHQRRANAVHAAAMGLGPPGWAAAAGISESLLAEWRRDPVFDHALTTAAAMAGADRADRAGQLNGVGLRLLLLSLAQGASLSRSATVVGLSLRQVHRIRRSGTAVSSLIDAAILRGRSRRAHKPASGYRLVHRAEDPPSAPPASSTPQ
ncbi:hypothetical protein ACFWTC_25605 [Streptomyces sp. NPDC058619]|uniref:hypothetical protein n=1 Tax=unclassified Streptomyces TaxID=2593676 RepID=UPI00364CF538